MMIITPDGPIFHFILTGTKTNGSDDGAEEALDIMNKLTDEEHQPSDGFSMISIRLLKILNESEKNDREKLIAFREYRNSLFNLVRKDEVVDYDQRIVIGVYRLIIELAFSVKTLSVLKKIACSCLSLIRNLANEQTIHPINDAIVDSVVFQEKWSDPIKTLFDVLSYQPTLELIQNNCAFFMGILTKLSKCSEEIKCEIANHSCLFDTAESDLGIIASTVGREIDQGVSICSTLRLFLNSFDFNGASYDFDRLLRNEETRTSLNDILESLMQNLVVPIISCKVTSSDSLSVSSVVMGYILLWSSKVNNTDEFVIANRSYDFIKGLSFGLPEVNQVALYRGLVSTLPDQALSHTLQSTGNGLWMDIASFLLRVTSESTDNAARLSAMKGLDTVMSRLQCLLLNLKSYTFVDAVRILCQDILYILISTWESPPSKQIESSIPQLFNNLVSLLEVLDSNQSNEAIDSNSIDVLVRTILAQPTTRKGRYVALDILLPKVGATKLFQLTQGKDVNQTSLVESFLSEIGRRANTSGAVAELLAKMLNRLRIEMESNVQSHVERSESDEPCNIPRDWFDIWVSSTAMALLTGSRVQKSSVSSFWLPLVPVAVGGVSCKLEASYAFSVLLEKLNQLGQQKGDTQYKIWAGIEVCRHAEMLRLLKVDIKSPLRAVIKSSFPKETLFDALTHESSALRISAFQTIGPILMSSDKYCSDSYECALSEIELWKKALPYAFKCSEKEYLALLSQTLMLFLMHLSEVDVSSLQHAGDFSSSRLLVPFVNCFLIDDVFVNQAAYPGTVSEKEKFALVLMETIITFSAQSDSFPITKKVPKNPSKKMKPIHEKWKEQIIYHILCENVLSTFFSLIHSQWDNTRSSSYELISYILHHGTRRGQKLPRFLTEPFNYRLLEARGLHLASSPRQRESDAGARLLTTLWYSRGTESDRDDYLNLILSKLKVRVDMMESALGLSDSCGFDAKKPLPLAHGLIQTVRLVLENSLMSGQIGISNIWSQHELLCTCIRAIEVSLIVVADVKVDEEVTPDSIENWKLARSSKSSSVPLNVNTGAIGANGSFTNLEMVDEIQMERRLVIQRLVVGNWLLIKEATSLLPRIIRLFPKSSFENVNLVGNLLISCLVTLKHQGGAFAAHKALENLCRFCSSPSAAESIRILPTVWAKRFIVEISGSKTAVRDSTLRRSTGYGLGFLAILRAEQTSPRVLFSFVLTNIIKLSLPPLSVMKNYMMMWQSNPDQVFFYTRSLSDNEKFVPDDDYDNRSRIHALNILRLITLDAPLSESMREYVGDSIISALIGYKDSSWNVRNSSTMTYSAAMLRVVDADKNADVLLRDSEMKPIGNAITCKELFRSYPPLLSTLTHLIKDEGPETSSSRSLHPALFPLFLLLARLQPLTLQRCHIDDSSVSDKLIDPIMRSLGHAHHKVRMVASRALAILCVSEHSNEMSSRSSMLRKCVSISKAADITNHNLHHGILLAIKTLLAFAPVPQNHCSEDILDLISHFASWGNFKCESHPCCTAIALEIQYDLYIRGIRVYGLEFTLYNTASKIIDIVENLAIQGVQLVGMPTLAKAASSIASLISFDVIFYQSVTRNTQIDFCESFRSFINSNVYDIMVQSVKSFKKGIYQAVDSICGDIGRRFDISILKEIANVCLKSAISFLCSKTLPHTPTLRRLTRIALECIYAHKKLVGRAFSLSNFLDMSSDEMWATIESLLVIGGFSLEHQREKNEALGSGNGLACNSVELMALYVSDLVCCKSHSIDIEKGVDKISKYVFIIRQACDPLAHWTLRYSAALGTLHSQIICPQKRISEFEHLRLQVLLHLFELLQDCDEDVRRQVGQTFFTSESRMAPISLLRLEQVSKDFSEKENTSQMLDLLTKRLLSVCKNVLTQVSAIIKEYNFTMLCQDSLNIDNDREIFEEEDPNPYEEVLVIIHSTVIMLCNISDDRLNVDVGARIDLLQIQKICSETLFALYQNFLRTGESDFSHNMSFVGTIFPFIHGLILGSTYSLWVGLDDNFDLHKWSNCILSLEHICLHPSLIRALKIMNTVNTRDQKSLQSIKQCSFLLPFTTS